MNMSIRWRAVTALGGLLLICCQGALADVSVSIRGVVQAPTPCVINAGVTLSVPFGSDLMTTQIDGVKYEKTVPYTVTCGPQPTNSMTLTLTGAGAAFDATALRTSKGDLGIRLKVRGVTWPLNTAVNFTYPLSPGVTAVLVKRSGSTLTSGSFTAAATLVVALR